MTLFYLQEGLSITHPPMFNGTGYTYQKTRMSIFLLYLNFDLWNIIELDFQTPAKPINEWNDFEKKSFSLNVKAMNVLLYALDKNKFNRISIYETVHDSQHTFKITHEDTNRIKDSKINLLMHSFELF